MPVEERGARSIERCDQHPTRSAVARCEGCGRPLCLSCAVPVRGATLGTECLPEPFGQERPSLERAGSTPLEIVAGVGLAVALLATALPWSRFGVGSGPFGAWGQPLRWASLTVAASVVGVLVWVARRALVSPPHVLDLVVAASSGLAALGALAAIWHPPAFARTWIGPWIALAGASVALGCTLVERRTAPKPSAVRS